MKAKPVASEAIDQLEAQVRTFYDAARASRRYQSVGLTQGGFELSLRYNPDLRYSAEEHLGEVLVIAGIFVPERSRRQGMFWRLCKFCLALADRGMAIEIVTHHGLYAALQRNPEFMETTPRDFLYLKDVEGSKPTIKLPDYSLIKNMFAAGRLLRESNTL